MSVGMVAVFLAARGLMSLFTDDVVVINFGVSYLRIAAFIFYAYVIHFMSYALFRGFKKPLIPLLMGLARQIVFSLIIFYLVVFVFKFNIAGLWWSIFAIVWFFALAYLYFVKRLLRQ